MINLQDILDNFDLDLPVTDEMKNVELMSGNYNPITKYYVDGNKYIFKGKITSDSWAIVTVDLDKMIIDNDATDDTTGISTFSIYDSKGEVIEFGY